VQDSEFYGVSIKRCGNSSLALGGINIAHVPSGGATNSLAFFGGSYEDCPYAFVIDEAYAIKILGMNFRGLDSGVAELLRLVGAYRTQVIGCRFDRSRRRAIVLLEGTRFPASVITGNIFTNPVNTETENNTGAWNIEVNNGKGVIRGNYFGPGTHTSYADSGGDILLSANTLDAQGTNFHLGEGKVKIQRNYTPTPNVFAPPRIDAKLVQSVWNGNALQMANWFFWVFNSEFRMNNGAPSGQSSGSVVGP
jgi:hypothetical protein